MNLIVFGYTLIIAVVGDLFCLSPFECHNITDIHIFEYNRIGLFHMNETENTSCCIIAMIE